MYSDVLLFAVPPKMNRDFSPWLILIKGQKMFSFLKVFFMVKIATNQLKTYI